MFFWNSLAFFHDPADVGNLISSSSAFSKSSLNIRKFTVHILLKPGLENFKHYFSHILKKSKDGLIAQWLRIHLPMQGTWFWSLVWEDSTSCRATKPICHNYWAWAQESVLCNKPPQWEAPHHCNWRVAPMATARESPCAATKTWHRQKLQIIKFRK